MKDTGKSQAALFKTLSHPVRLSILEILRDGEQCVCHMEATLGRRQSYISQHLIVLREAGILAVRQEGWNVYYHVAKPEVYSVLDAMYAMTGKPDAVRHRHAEAECPCPKCQGEGQRISTKDVGVIAH